MQLHSLAIKTDLIFARFNGEVIDRESYLVIRTPSNCGYHWGNYLVFPGPPERGDEKRWPALFKQEFNDLAGINHIAFTWDMATPGSFTESFVSKGFNFESNKVLAATRIQLPPKINSEVTIKKIESDPEWEVVTLEQLGVNEKYEPIKYEKFKRSQMANYRKMVVAGLGNWFGAFLGGRLVADLGVFCDDSVARFQSVVTQPAYRRQGICGRMVYETAKFALENFKAETLVMVADENYHAAKIYESVGFVPVQSNYTLAWWNDKL